APLTGSQPVLKYEHTSYYPPGRLPYARRTRPFRLPPPLRRPVAGPPPLPSPNPRANPTPPPHPRTPKMPRRTQTPPPPPPPPPPPRATPRPPRLPRPRDSIAIRGNEPNCPPSASSVPSVHLRFRRNEPNASQGTQNAGTKPIARAPLRHPAPIAPRS